MNKTLSDIITEAIVTNTPKDVTIHERTLATELIESEKKQDPFSLYDFLPRSFRGKNLVLTRHLIYFSRCIVLFFIALCYALYDLLHKFFTGEWKSKPLDEEVRARRIPNKKWIKKLHPEKWRGIQSSSGLNAIIVIVILIVTTIALVWGLHFLIKEVVLSNNDCRVNHYGIVTFDQGCFEEQHFFLLNAASFWTNTGIAVSKGDNVYITASGSMYSDVDNMVDAADSNITLLYPRSDFYKQYNKKDKDAKCCIYGRFPNDTVDKNNKPTFGSLLYQICDEVRGPRPFNDFDEPSAVRQINFAKNKNSIFKDKRYHFRAPKSGILYFSFNDILLDDRMINTITKNKKQFPQLYKALLKTSPCYCCYYGFGCCCCSCSRFSSRLKSEVDSLIWFEDNFGEALVNIRIEKNIWNAQLPLHKKILVAFYRRMNALYTKTEKGFPIDFLQSGLLIVILLILLWFGVDATISNRLKKKDVS